MAGVETIAETLAAYKIIKLSALADAFALYSPTHDTDYTAENLVILKAFDTDGITAINAALKQ